MMPMVIYSIRKVMETKESYLMVVRSINIIRMLAELVV
jgi:hypothetical protein